MAGKRREKEVSDFPGKAAVGQALIGLNFPADKSKILLHIYKGSVKSIQTVKKWYWY